VAGPLHLCGANGAFHGARDALCHAFLEGEGVLDLAVPSVGPQMLTGRRVGQHHQNPHPPRAVVPHRSAQPVARIAGPADREPAVARQGGRDLVADGQRGLRLHADDIEGEHADDGAIDHGRQDR